MGVRVKLKDLSPRVRRIVDALIKADNRKRYKMGAAGSHAAGSHADPRMEGMNKTEQRYAHHLDVLKMAGDVTSWEFEPRAFPLAHRCKYTPDFCVVFADGRVEWHEIKARWADGRVGWQPDARIKIKVAAAIYPDCKFVAFWPDGKGWSREDFKARLQDVEG